MSQSPTVNSQSNGALLEGSLDDAYEHCRRVTRHHAKSFYFCATFLPPLKRRAIYAVYALCRTIDDFVDRSADRDAADTRAILDQWRGELRDDRGVGHPALRAWRDAAATYGIPAEHAEELMRGVLMDLTTTRYASYDELEIYCYRVAAVVGLMTSEIFGYSDPRALEHAIKLGLAMQLTNICRDVGEDAAMGRVYLPADELERFGVSPAALLAGRTDGRFEELMRFQIGRARRLYQEAEPGIDMLSADCRYAVRLSSRVYGKILDAIERNGYDVMSLRAYVPLHSKLATIPAVLVETHLPFVRPSIGR